MNEESCPPSSSFDTHLLCVLCRQPVRVGEPTIPTTTGELVHVTCADRDAAAVAHHRQQQALAQGVLTIVVDMILLAYAQFVGWVLLLILAGAVLHGWIHRVWWRALMWQLWRVLLIKGW